MRKVLKRHNLVHSFGNRSVKVLDNDNFDGELAIATSDEKKTLFVKFYRPQCNHCKALAPKWEALGEEFKVRPKYQFCLCCFLLLRGVPIVIAFPTKLCHVYASGTISTCSVMQAEGRSDIIMGEVNCDAHEKTCQKQGVNSHPTLIKYTAENVKLEFPGEVFLLEKEPKHMREFVDDHAGYKKRLADILAEEKAEKEAKKAAKNAKIEAKGEL